MAGKTAIPLKMDTKKFKYNKIIIDVTNRCNLNCPVCYLGDTRDKEDLPIEEIKNLSHKYRNKTILICGGEPTIREDLPEIIRLFNNHNTVFLVTNGLNFTNYNYLQSLKKNGLRYVSFSFNGFSDEAYRKINGVPLRDQKLEALKNIKKAKIKVILSVLVVRGINEDQISNILDYCLKNRDFIEELRIRSMVSLGNHLNYKKYTVSELLQLICASKNFQEADILKEIQLQETINAAFRIKFFPPKDCSLNFHLNINGSKVSPIGSKIKSGKPDLSGHPLFIQAGFKLLNVYGLRMVVKGLLKSLLKYEKSPWIHFNDTFKIGLRSWPENQEHALETLENCQTAYYLHGRLFPFCYANIQRTTGKI